MMKTHSRFLIALGVGLGCSAATQAAPQSVPTMTIKIYNDDPKNYIFPVYTTGQHRGSGLLGDIWLQAIFGNTVAQIQSNKFNYNSNQSYRFYVTNKDHKAPLGIPPNQSVSLTIPLYTQLVDQPEPSAWNQYADWWNGATIQLFYSTDSTPPRALTQEYGRPTQSVLHWASGAALPTCDSGCEETLMMFWDTTDLKKEDPSQLIEFTLGARVQQCPYDQCGDQPPNALDLSNVDFDVSYVNLAYGPAAMGPYKNDQVGYVGTPQSLETFSGAITRFLDVYKDWPQFVATYNANDGETILKIPSPLDIFPRLSGKDPPPDLTPVADKTKWPEPDSLWAPIKALYTNWTTWAGSIDKNTAPQCTRGDGKQFCDALLNAKALLLANYAKYVTLFGQGKPCGDGPSATLTDSLMVAHVYGWTPFTEGDCPPDANLLENTPGYADNNYELYATVKEQYDLLNYGRLQNKEYDFNPYVTLIHGMQYANVGNAYAYSVDDAVGNVQAEGAGIVIDFADTKHLENQTPARSPININFGFKNSNISFTQYATCNDNNWKPTRSYFNSFIINANNPRNCPVYLEDDKVPPQRYTFTVMADPSAFPSRPDPKTQIWDAQTAKPILCKGNTDQAPYQPSSRQWCCDITASAGIKAFSVPEAHSAHQSESYYVITEAPKTSRLIEPRQDESCSEGAKWP